MKLFLIDAYALIYRSYYAFIKNPRINSKGMNTSAIFGFINSLEDVLKRENPTHIAVAFDPKGPTFRHEAYEQYKAQRQETPEDIRKSVPFIKNIIEAYNIPILEVPRYEADDVIGTVAKQAEKEGFEVYMMTPDKDYGQLVSERIFMYRPRFGGDYEIMGVPEVLGKYGLTSVDQVIDLLGLMGDSSDNIPGCPGVGEKTAQKLLTEFGTIENLLENTDKLKGSLQKKVTENREQIRFSKFLATIKTDAPIRFDAVKCIREKINEERLVEIYTELEFRTFINKIVGEPEKAKTESKATSAPAKTGTRKKAAPAGPIQGSLFEEFAAEPTAVPKYSTFADLKSTRHTYHLVDTEEKIAELGLESRIGRNVVRREGKRGLVRSCSGSPRRSGQSSCPPLSCPAESEIAQDRTKHKIRYPCRPQIWNPGSRPSIRYDDRPLPSESRIASRHGLPCRNIP